MPAAIVRPAATLGLERAMLMSLAICLSLVACQEPEAVTGPTAGRRALLAPTSTTLTASRDGYVTSKHPNRNGGWKDSMDVAQPLRSLVGFDQAAIAAAVGSGTLTNATLRLTIGRTADNWGPDGRTVDVHRLTARWTEEGATYNCAIDGSPDNSTKECSGPAEWDMASSTAPPWALPRTAQALVTTGTTGVLAFDVTADVVAFLNGTPNEGWIIKKTDEEKQGRIVFMTKEGGAAPELVLTIVPETPDTARPTLPGLSDFTALTDTTKVASPPGDTVTIAYRNVFAVRFDDSTSGTTIRSFLAAMRGEIISGNPGAEEYIIQFPDPGPTYQSVDSLQRAIMSRVGVDYAVPSKRRTGAELNARYPDDGIGARRADWTGTPTDFTRPRLQIRAPLAWGCENGEYGGPRASVGVVDFFFNRSSPDLAGLLAAPSEPVPGLQPMKASAVNQDHGSEVAGIMVGAGNDGGGIAGMLWSAELSLFSLTTNGEEPADLVQYLVGTVLPEAARRGVRVLVMSVTLGDSDTLQVRRIEQAIARYVASGGLIVKAASNFGGFRTVAQLLQVTNHAKLATEIAVARLLSEDPQARSGLLFVAGTEENGHFWEGGSFYSGITDILAPATNVATLDRNGVLHTVSSGNSLAAPFVGGVAGLLLAMDPSLTNAELKDYLIRGSRVTREDPATGDWVPAPNPGAPDPEVRQLDAYGSLRLLSYERPGTPLCGLTITNTGSVWSQVQSVIQREGVAEGVEVDGQPVAFTSIAQGGRLAAAGTEQYRLAGGQWVGAGNAGTDAVVFLEQDTAYLRPVESSGPLWVRTDLQIRIGSGDPARRFGPANITQGFPANLAGAQVFEQSASYTPELVSVSPTGDWVYLEYAWSFNDDCYTRPPEGEEFRLLFPLRGGQVREFSRRTYSGGCDGPGSEVITSSPAAGGRIAWRADGGEFYYAREYYDANTRLERWNVGNGVQQVGSGEDVGPLAFDALVWSNEGGRLLSRERTLWYVPYEEQACYNRVRASGAVGVITTSVAEGGPPNNACSDMPLAAIKLASAFGLHVAPGTQPPARFKRRYPLGIPGSLRAN